jgi:imidazolonepropionase-like amidohydrolase
MNAQRIALGLSAFGMLWAQAHARDLWIENVVVVSPERAAPLRGASVYVHDGHISRIASRSDKVKLADVEVFGGAGLYLAPGLIDTHVHLGEVAGMRPEDEQAHPDIARAARAQSPRSYLHFGFTTLVDLNSTPQAMAAWNAHDIHPDSYFCGGTPIVDGYPTNYAPKPMRYQVRYLLVEPGAASSLLPDVDPAAHTPEAVVTKMKSDGAICVKTFFERGFGAERNLPVPQLATIRALVRAAHAAGLPVLLHANSSDAQSFGLEAGVDVFAHGLWNWNEPSATTEITPAVRKILDGVIDGKRGWQPTMQVLYGLRDLFNESFLSDPMVARAVPASLIEWYATKDGQWFHDVLAGEMGPAQVAKIQGVFDGIIARVRSSVAYLATHDGRVLFGSDTPSGPIYTNPPGLNGWMEMQRLIEAGMTPAQLFRAATLSNAEALGLDREVGTVQVGKRANLLLLRQDPTQTIHAYDHIEKVILHGRVFDAAELAANRNPERPR